MTSFGTKTLTAVPWTVEVRSEIAKAIRALAAQDEDEKLRLRRAEMAAIRSDLEQLAQSLRDACREADPRMRSYVQKYSPNQPRVPAGNCGGGQWMNEEGAGGPSEGQSDSDSSSRNAPRPVRYAALDTGTRTDAAGGSSTQYAQDFPPEWSGPIVASPTQSPRISAYSLSSDNPKRPVAFVDSSNVAVTDGNGDGFLRPADLPPETFVSEGAASHLAEYIQLYNDAMQAEPDSPSETNEQAILSLGPKIASELGPFRQGGSLDAERIGDQYVPEYHD